MQIPGDSNRIEKYIRLAERKINLSNPLYIDTVGRKIEGHHCDGILVLPEVPTLTRNQPVPSERRVTGGFTSLENVASPKAIQSARATIAQQR